MDARADTGHTPLHGAVMKDHSRMVELLVGYGADPSITQGDGETALHMTMDNEDLNPPSDVTVELSKVSVVHALRTIPTTCHTSWCVAAYCTLLGTHTPSPLYNKWFTSCEHVSLSICLIRSRKSSWKCLPLSRLDSLWLPAS